MRDAILAALDNRLKAGTLTANQHTEARSGIWTAFAKFGMGPAARSDGAGLSGIVADFKAPGGQVPVPQPPQPPSDSRMRLTDTPNLAIPDAQPAGVTRVLGFPHTGQIQKLAVSHSIQHPSAGDLQVSLTAPGNKRVLLYNRTWSADANLIKSYTSEDTAPLSDLVGQQAHGDWTLTVADCAAGDVGVLQTWSLEIILK